MRDHPTVERAIDRLADAAQSIVTDQIEGARLDATVVGGRILRSAALVMAGALALGGAWAALTTAVYMLLAPYLSPEQRLGVIACSHGLLGLGLVLGGVRVMNVDDHD